MHDYSFDARKKIWNENVQRKYCQESSNMPFAVPGNVKLKLPIIRYPAGKLIPDSTILSLSGRILYPVHP
jgi:hypothetical protein